MLRKINKKCKPQYFSLSSQQYQQFAKNVKPEKGYKLPKLKEGEEIVGFRPTGNVDIFSKAKNYNFTRERMNFEQKRFKIVKIMCVLSLIPMLLFFKNAEQALRKAKVKEMPQKRRERLDKEHNVDRDVLQQSYKELDDMYRVTEKEEIKKYMEVGKTAQDYYNEKEGYSQRQQEKEDQEDNQVSSSTDSIKRKLLKKDEESGMELSYIEGDSYQQVQVKSAGESPDPRVAGPKIIFDSRLDKFQTPEQSKEYIKQQQQQLQPYTLDDKKKMLMKILNKENTNQGKEEENKQEEQQLTQEEQESVQQKQGFQRKQQKKGFKNDAEAAPIYEPNDIDEIQDGKESALLEVVEKYNLINTHLKKYNQQKRNYISYLMVQLIPSLQSLEYDEILHLMQFVEDSLYKMDESVIADTQGYESMLKLKFAKKAIDQMLSQNLNEVNDIPDPTKSIDNSIVAIQIAINEYNKLKQQVKSLKDYLVEVKNIEKQGFDTQQFQVDKSKLEKYIKQLQELERKLDYGNIKIVDNEKETEEHSIYNTHYNKLKEKIEEIQNYIPNITDNDYTSKLKDLKEYFNKLKEEDKFNEGIQKLVESDLSKSIIRSYKNIMGSEVDIRDSYENKIENDIQILLSDQENQQERIQNFIASEIAYDTFYDIQKAQSKGLPTAEHKFEVDQEKAAKLMKEIIGYGIPGNNELFNDTSKLSQQTVLQSVYNRILSLISQQETSQQLDEYNVSYYQHIANAQEFIIQGEINEAYKEIKQLKDLHKNQNQYLNQLLFKYECRLFAERMSKDYLREKHMDFLERETQL